MKSDGLRKSLTFGVGKKGERDDQGQGGWDDSVESKWFDDSYKRASAECDNTPDARTPDAKHLVSSKCSFPSVLHVLSKFGCELSSSNQAK